MLETEIKQAFSRYDFLVELLNNINESVNGALKNDNRWFAFAPKIGAKFLNQALTLKLLFYKEQMEISRIEAKSFEDLSAIFTMLRTHFETHALFYHLFMPCSSIEENILRFRLWELDGIRSRIKINTGRTPAQIEKLVNDQKYQKTIEQTIIDLSYYMALDSKVQKFLLDKAVWRFTDKSLSTRPLRAISYDLLIRQTGIAETIYADLYAYLSMHTHPSYVGVVQSFSFTDDEIGIGRYVAIIQACYVTSFMIEDLSKRFVQGNEVLSSLTELEKSVYNSIRDAGRANENIVK